MAEQLSKPVVAQVQQIVYRRPLADGAQLLNGEQDGWLVEPRLRCDSIVNAIGLRGSSAQFAFVAPSIDDTTVAFEEAMKAFSTDDQVRVEVFPPNDPLVQQEPTDPPKGKLRFEGVLRRHQFQVDPVSGEQVTLLAHGTPTVMNRQTEHLVYGRWVAHETFASRVIESMTLPAVFNFRGKPNRNPYQQIKPAIPSGGYMESVADLRAFVFTHDSDPAGQYWTFRQALASLVIRWLYGSHLADEQPDVKPRVVMLAPETLALLSADSHAAGDRQLPEVNVHGLGVLAAIDAICRAANWLWACELSAPLATDDPATNLDETASEAEAANWRPYQLRIWQRNQGVPKWVDLAKRGSDATDADVETTLANNTVNKITGIVDRGELATEVYGVGRVVIEHTWAIKPLWAESDMHSAAISGELQKVTEAKLASASTYHAKHVQGGVLFDRWGHVGRAWGLAHASGFVGYTSGPYAHDPLGFDFAAEMGLNALTGLDYNAVYLERNSNGVVPPEMFWMKRPRLALPLKHPAARSIGQEYRLDVSEDGGATWQLCTVKFSVLNDGFGIVFNNVRNLASINNATFGTGEAPPVARSWWALIKSQQLRFTLTAGVEADHAARFDARRQATCGSRYYTAQLLPVDIEERWASPDHVLGNGVWTKLPTINSVGAVTATTVRDVAERQRDVVSMGVLSASVTTWQMVFDRWRLGDLIQGVRGRAYSFGVGAGDQAIYPQVVSVTEQIGLAQAIVLTLDDAGPYAQKGADL
jgi:hypothetical protein